MMAEKDERRHIGLNCTDLNSTTQMTEKKHKFSGEPEYEGECDPFVHRVAEKPNSTHVTEKNHKDISLDAEYEGEYNPFVHRVVENPNSIYGSLAHLLKSSMGTGIFAMPMAFKNGGLLLGVIGTIVIGYFTTLCVHMLVKTSHDICRKTKTPVLGYSETVEKVFENGPMAVRKWSKFAKKFCDYAVMANMTGSCCVYIIFVSQSMHDVLNFAVGINWDIRVYIAMLLLPLIIIGQIRVLKYLVPFSAIANFLMIFVFGITLYFIFSEPLKFDDKPLIASWNTLPYFFSTVVFAMGGITAVMPVENAMKEPQYFLGCPGVLNIAMITLAVLYGITGFFGFVRFGKEVKGSVSLNLPQGIVLAQVAQILIAVAILLSYGLKFYIAMDIFWRKIKHTLPAAHHNITQTVIRTAIICLQVGLTMAVPNLVPVIGLVGALFVSIVGIFVPSVVETVYLWPNLGRFRWKLFRNGFLAIAAICTLVAGTAVNLEDVIRMYRTKN